VTCIVYVQGATVVGIRATDGVVVAGEKRLGYGNFILSRKAKKVYLIDEKIAVGAAWLYADSQALIDLVENMKKRHELLSKSKLSVQGIVKLVSRILYSSKLLPYMTELIIAGYDHRGPQLYVLDALGGASQEKYAAVGSGSTTALGLIEDSYKEGIKVQEAAELATEAIRVAVRRDALSGDGIDIVVITAERAWEEYRQL